MFLNKVFVLGNLTADPEIKTLPSGQSVANFRIATNRVFYNKDKEKQEQVEFHSVVAFGRTAEIIQQYLQKGSMLLIEGRLQTRSWEDSAGNKKYRTEIITEKMQMGPKRSQPTVFNKKEETPSKKKEAKKEEEIKEEIPIIEEESEINVADIPF